MRLSKLMKRYGPTVIACMAALALNAAGVLAAGEETQLIRTLTDVLQKVSLVVGVVVLGYGLIAGWAAWGAGDEDSMTTARNAVIGGVLILMVFPVVSMVVGAAGMGSLVR